MTTEPRDVVVIGGGISGLSCAYRLHQLGHSVLLLEAEARPAGLLGTVHQGEFLFESGPQSFQGTETLVNLVLELGLSGELCQAPPKAPRYVLRRGKLCEIPLSPKAILSSSLLSVPSRLRIAAEALRRSKAPAEEESIAAFVRRKFGHEILEYLVTPFVSGVYAGDPEKLSLRAAFPTLEEWEREHGSVLRGALQSRKSADERSGKRPGPPPLCSFRQGIQTLADGLAQKLGDRLHTGSAAEAIESSQVSYRIHLGSAAGEAPIAARAVVCATPAYVAGHMVQRTAPSLAKLLSGIVYAPVVVVNHAYFEKQVGQTIDGFGVLVPRSERHHTLGIVWNSSLFPGRAPHGQVVLTSFLGGATDEQIMQKTDEEIMAIATRESAQILKIMGSPIASSAWRHPKALPQYNLGHTYVVEAVRAEERKIPGLFLTGNFLEGPAIGTCIETAYKTAESVSAFLKPGSEKS